MILYLGIFIIVLLAFLSSKEQNPRSSGLLGAIMMGLGLFVGLGDMLGGYDRYIYGELFDVVSATMSNGGNVNSTLLLSMYETEWGYTSLNLLIGLITQNRYIFIFILTLIIYILLYISFKKYTSNYVFAVLLFMGLWFFFTFTYLRQVIAAAIAWLAIEYAIDRKPIKFFTIVLIAYGFHNSAIVFAPLYFVPIRKYKLSVVLGVMAFCLVLGVSGLPDALFSQFGSLSGTEDRVAKYAEDVQENSFRIEYLLEAIVFLWFILTNYSVFEKDNKTQLVLLNMALVFCAILLFFIRSENGGRLGWFYLIGVISALTLIATQERKIKSSTIALIAMSAILFTRILVQWGIQIEPYKSFLTDGHREGDSNFYKYEYDKNYDVDKFYK